MSTVPKNYKYNIKYKDHIVTKENLLLLAILQSQRLETQLSQDSREQGLYTQRRASTGDFSQPELPSSATRFHGLLACIPTNGSFMGGLVTLDRNPSQYYRDWGYSSILVLHTPPLDRAKGGSMS